MYSSLTRFPDSYENERTSKFSQFIPSHKGQLSEATPPIMPTRHRRRRACTTSLEHLKPPPPRSPIAVVPVEILHEIFLWCIESPAKNAEWRYHSVDEGYTSRTAPLLLCRVNRAWRESAISLPSLWMSLDVYVSMGKARPALPLAVLWLARSGGLPLTLALYQQNESSNNRVAAGEILDLYKRYICRWRNIQFDLTGPRYCRLLTSQQRSAPMLQQFRMHTSYRVYEEEEKDLYRIFNSVPRLSHLHVSRIPDLSLFGDSSVSIPWRQLVSLSLDYVPSVGTTLHILEQCPKLIECTFKVDSIYGSLPRDPIFHKLNSLTINVGHEQIASFLDNVTCPALTQLVVYVRGPLDQYGWPQHKFGAFLRRSECRPIHFEIHDTGMRFDEFAMCLNSPQLQSLERIIVEDRRDWTWEPFVTDLALDLLTCSAFLDKSAMSHSSVSSANCGPAHTDAAAVASGQDQEAPNNERGRMTNSTCALPNLEALTFRGSCLWTADGAVADMVESRWRFHFNGVRRLRRVELELLSSHVEDFRRLQEFSTEGLELDLLFR